MHTNLGIAGLVGAGRSEAVKCIFGLSHKKSGTIMFKGRAVAFKNPGKAMEQGFGFVPEDRKKEGLFLQSSVRFNTTINVIPQFLLKLKWSRKIENNIVSKKIADMHIKVTNKPELINMSDRVMVMCNGYSTGILTREELGQESIMMLATTEVKAMEPRTGGL